MSSEHLDTLPQRLARAREVAGLNRSALALKAGLNPSHVRLIEEGHREDPTGSTLAKLAEALGVSLDWLVRGVGEGPATGIAGMVARISSTVTDLADAFDGRARKVS
jgi:transcriptional regulator with XRE-family HTH domain